MEIRFTVWHILALALLLTSLACTPKPKPAHIPPPPAAQPVKRAHKNATPRPDDWVIHDCIVTHEGKEYADCICRKPAHKLNSETGQYSLDCKPTPKERKK